MTLIFYDYGQDITLDAFFTLSYLVVSTAQKSSSCLFCFIMVDAEVPRCYVCAVNCFPFKCQRALKEDSL